jgi:4'-phosphopantetheinyl transferase EntD
MAAAIALCARTYSGVGIDIEEVVVDPSIREAMLGNIISIRELAHLRQPNLELSFDVLLTLVFSAKESFYKGTYGSIGRCFDFDAIELVRFDPVMQNIEFKVRETLSDLFRAGDVIETNFKIVDDKYVCTMFLR